MSRFHTDCVVDRNTINIVSSEEPQVLDLTTVSTQGGSVGLHINGRWEIDESIGIIYSLWESLVFAKRATERANQEKKEAQNREIKQMLTSGHLCKEKVEPSFFDDLFRVMEQNWSLCANVMEIDLSLDPTADYTKNLYSVKDVLNSLIVRSNLQVLRLKHFGPNLLLGSLATLREMDQLDFLDVSDNQLETKDFDFVLRLIPGDTIDPVDVNFLRNRITDEESVAIFLCGKPNIRSVKIRTQSPRDLDLGKIRAFLSPREIVIDEGDDVVCHTPDLTTPVAV